MSSKKIGILYICTGVYSVFWEDFYKSFERNFLPATQKEYFVFTDASHLYDEDKNSRIHKIYLENTPWPLPTLMKFHVFLKHYAELSTMDYLYQSNANILCSKIVSEEEFLPNDKRKPLIFTVHPGYMSRNKCYHPYERNRKSSAYIPYNCGGLYVYGAMNGGESGAYLKLAKELSQNIENDLKKNIIAAWHDESHINRYVNCHDDFRLLSPSYCYPIGFSVNYDPKITGVDKASKFDVASLKGYSTQIKHNSRIRHMASTLKHTLLPLLYWIIDAFFNKAIN